MIKCNFLLCQVDRLRAALLLDCFKRIITWPPCIYCILHNMNSTDIFIGVTITQIRKGECIDVDHANWVVSSFVLKKEAMPTYGARGMRKEPWINTMDMEGMVTSRHESKNVTMIELAQTYTTI